MHFIKIECKFKVILNLVFNVYDDNDYYINNLTKDNG